jgi:hypothetical protein
MQKKSAQGGFAGGTSSLSWWSDLNRRPAVYETAALPLSYTSVKSLRTDASHGALHRKYQLKYRKKELFVQQEFIHSLT